jgi:hypothetical protein
MRSAQYFSLREHLEVDDDLPPTEKIAARLDGATWK